LTRFPSHDKYLWSCDVSRKATLCSLSQLHQCKDERSVWLLTYLMCKYTFSIYVLSNNSNAALLYQLVKL